MTRPRVLLFENLPKLHSTTQWLGIIRPTINANCPAAGFEPACVGSLFVCGCGGDEGGYRFPKKKAEAR
jgi:hypothetical protein